MSQVSEPFCRRDKGGHPTVSAQGISNLVGQAWMSHLTCSHSYWWSSVQLFFVFYLGVLLNVFSMI